MFGKDGLTISDSVGHYLHMACRVIYMPTYQTAGRWSESRSEFRRLSFYL